MPKTYKHRTLWLVAKEYVRSWRFSVYQKNDDWTEVEIASNVIALLIWSDREEVVEKDWIDKLYSEIPSLNDKELFRRYVEQHAPKQKMFTREDVYSTIRMWDKTIEAKIVIQFLQAHNLLSSDE